MGSDYPTASICYVGQKVGWCTREHVFRQDFPLRDRMIRCGFDSALDKWAGVMIMVIGFGIQNFKRGRIIRRIILEHVGLMTRIMTSATDLKYNGKSRIHSGVGWFNALLRALTDYPTLLTFCKKVGNGSQLFPSLYKGVPRVSWTAFWTLEHLRAPLCWEKTSTHWDQSIHQEFQSLEECKCARTLGPS